MPARSRASSRRRAATSQIANAKMPFSRSTRRVAMPRVQLEDHFGVATACGSVRRAPRASGAQLLVVVDLAVEDDRRSGRPRSIIGWWPPPRSMMLRRRWPRPSAPLDDSCRSRRARDASPHRASRVDRPHRRSSRHGGTGRRFRTCLYSPRSTCEMTHLNLPRLVRGSVLHELDLDAHVGAEAGLQLADEMRAVSASEYSGRGIRCG